SPLCPAAAPAAAALSLMSCPGSGAGSGRRRRWEGSGLSPAHFRPRFPASCPGLRSPEQEAGCCGRGCSGAGSPLCPGPAESVPAVPPGSLSFRPCRH
ncbi:unnamed protein product, partial [Coccothraustes coccothraustes]